MKTTTKNIAFTALLTAMICVLSPFSIPLGVIPFSFGSLAVYIASALIGKRQGIVSVIAFVALGAFGVPVFTGFTGGFGVITGLTGGYILGYVLCAVVVGVIVDGLETHVWAYPLAMILGTALLYAFGTGWYVFQTQSDVLTALAVCVVPFLIGDVIKITIATALCYKLRFILKKQLRA